MASHFRRSGRYRLSAWVAIFTFAGSHLCSAQATTAGEPATQSTAPADALASGIAFDQLPRSRRPLTSDEFSSLIGQSLSVSIRDRWPPRVVKGTIVGVSTDSVIVNTAKNTTSLPISKTIVVSPLPGDFVDLLGHKVQVTGRRRFPPSDITGRVVDVDVSHVTIDKDGELVRLPIASTSILSRTPDRDRKRERLFAAAFVVGGWVWVDLKCRNGGC